MTQSKNNYCLILAGGVGSRLWPASREICPKQYKDLSGTGYTLIQQTYQRFARFIAPENIYVSTQESYVPLLLEQLPQLQRHQILAALGMDICTAYEFGLKYVAAVTETVGQLGIVTVVPAA